MKNDYTFPSAITISDEAKDLIKKTLILDPASRLTLDEILEHPFIKNNAENTKNKSSGIKKPPTLVTVQSPVANGTLPTEPGCKKLLKYVFLDFYSPIAYFFTEKYRP